MTQKTTSKVFESKKTVLLKRLNLRLEIKTNFTCSSTTVCVLTKVLLNLLVVVAVRR